MADCVLRAAVVWTPRNDLGQFISGPVTDGAVAGVTAWGTLVLDRAVELAPERTGGLKRSGRLEVTAANGRAVARVIFDSPHAAFNEFGTGQRGASSAGAGPYAYDPNWVGMPASPFIRPASDEMKSEGADLCRQTVALALR